jgi:CTP:molybdopterin cytidylyltransferase MocA
MPSCVHVGVVLAAGRSTRTGFPKALAELDGETFVARTLGTLREGGCDSLVLVVAPPHDTAIEGIARADRVARNPAPERGMLSSLQVGIEAALADHPELRFVVFALVDHPRVRAETVRVLLAHAERTDTSALRPVFEGRGGHPVVLSRAVAQGLLGTNAASVREAVADMVTWCDLLLDDPAVVDDADTPEALDALGAKPPQ